MKNKSVLLRYICSGGIAAATDLFLLYFFIHFYGVHYLVAAIIAFIVAFVVSFIMQKFWTFRENSKERMGGQLVLFFFLALINLVVNTLLMYIFVGRLHIPYLLGQVLASGIIALFSFFIYHTHIFNHQEKTEGMRMLLITQKIDKNDGLFGFVHRWIIEFAKNTEKLTVICLYKGEYDFPPHVTVFSLGKEKGISRLGYLKNFFYYIWRERDNYDQVFVHMNQMYVILGGVFWRIFGKKIGLWYAHAKVTFSLRVAERLAHIIFTSTPKGFRLPTTKLAVVGQGIDTAFFSYKLPQKASQIRVLSIGRISPVKDYETLIGAIKLVAAKKPVILNMVGEAGTPEQEAYLTLLKKKVSDDGLDASVRWLGAIANKDIVPFLHSADVFVNTSHTGSLDKTGVEAISAGLPLLTCNEAYFDLLSDYRDSMTFNKGDSQALARQILEFSEMDQSRLSELTKTLRQSVESQHELSSLVKKIIARYRQL